MHLIKYTLLASALAAGCAMAAGNPNNGPLPPGQLKIPAIWKSPLFKTLGNGGGPGPLDSHPHTQSSSSPPPTPPSNSSLQQNLQLHPPAPILTSPTQSCTITLLNRSFSNSYGSPSTFSYSPSSFSSTPCSDPSSWTGLTLDLHGETRGRQFDRLGTVWIGNDATGQGVEILRFDNPEPTRTGVYWDVSKDVGKYWNLWSRQADVVVDLPNVVDSTYTGALNVTLKLTASIHGSISVSSSHRHRRAATSSRGVPALPLKQRAPDVVLPLSKRMQTSNSVFLIGGTAGNGTTPVTIPPSTARAVVEVYASGTASEEFWYTGIPDRFYNEIPDAADNGYYGKGSYREIQLRIDGRFAGFVTPFPVIFTGGINPLLWRPSGSFGAYDQPTYNIDVTPWLGELTDGKQHEFELSVVSSEKGGETNDASWFVSGNVQVYLDPSGKETTGELVRVDENGGSVDGYTKGKLDGNPLTNGTLKYEVGVKGGRKFSVAGRVKTGSQGEFIAGWTQVAQYTNKGVVNASTQVNDQVSYGFARSLLLPPSSRLLDSLIVPELSLEDLAGKQVQAVQMDFNYPLTVRSTLTGDNFTAEVEHSFDRVVRRTRPHTASSDTRRDVKLMIGEETTFVQAKPVAALDHTIMWKGKTEAVSVLKDGAIANGTGKATQTFMYKDMAVGTIDRTVRTDTSGVLQDRLGGSIRGRAQPPQLVVV